MQITIDAPLTRDQSARLVLLATMQKVERRARAASKRRDLATVVRLAEDYRRLQAALLTA